MSNFIRLHIIAEGQTEEKFVKETLSVHLGSFQISTDVRRVLTSRDKRNHKVYLGGLLNYEKAKNDIQTWLKEDKHPEARFTTMFDLYALPHDFPGYKETKKLRNPYQKIEFLEKALEKDIADSRFIAYIQLHEFEALVLANPETLKLEYFERENAITDLQKILEQAEGNSELINDGPETAPSKRILSLIPEYDKVSVGAAIAGINGIDFLKKKCRHFSCWVKTLENLPNITQAVCSH